MAKVRSTCSIRYWLWAAASTAGCLASSGPAYPLYPDPSNKRAPEEVATLLGDVATVDGINVSEHGADFELLPGCHIVGVPEHWGKTSYDHTIWANVGHVSFAIDMQAQHRYVVRIDVSQMGGNDGRLSISAREEQLDGTVTRSFKPIEGAVPNGSCGSGEATSS